MYGYGMFLATNGIVQSGGGLTARTTAFKTATGITDATILNALNTLDLGLISNGLDSKLYYLFPFVGGNSTKHSYNFIDTTKHQITWLGGMTHSSNGITCNGTNSYGKVSDTTSYDLQNTYGSNVVFGCTIRNNSNVGCDIGCKQDVYQYGIELFSRSTDNLLYNSSFDTLVNGTYSHTNTIGTWIVNRIGGTKYIYKNGTQVQSSVSSVSTIANYQSVQLLIGASNRSGNSTTSAPSFYSDKNYSSHFLGFGMSATDVANLNTLINTFNTTLGR